MENPYHNQFLKTVRGKSTEELVEILTSGSSEYSGDFLDVVYKVLDEERHCNMEQFKKEEPETEGPVFHEVNRELFDYCDSMLDKGHDAKAVMKYLSTHGVDESTAEKVVTYCRKETRRDKTNFISAAVNVLAFIVLMILINFCDSKTFMPEDVFFTVLGVSLVIWLVSIITFFRTRESVAYDRK